MPRVIHFDIASANPGKTIAFYSGVFGWKFERYSQSGMVDYWIINTGDSKEHGINGGMLRSEAGSTSGGGMIGISVSSIDEFISKVKVYGGKTLTNKVAISGVGYFVDCESPDGNQFSMIEWNEDIDT